MPYTHVLYLATTQPANNIGSVLVPKDGKLLSVDWHVSIGVSAADYVLLAEIATVPVQAVTLTGSDQVISAIVHAIDLTTSGAAPNWINFTDPLGGMGVRVGQGERLYLNASGTAVNVTWAILLRYDFTISR